jgi:hypothetical protein
VAELPAGWRSRVDYAPVRAGVVDIDVAIAERPLLARSRHDVIVHGVRALGDDRFRLELASPLRAGELWSLDGSWQRHRRSLEVGVAVPRLLGLPGVWRAGIGARELTYASPRSTNTREVQRTLSSSLSDWATGALRWETRASLDEWTDRGRYARLGGEVALRAVRDHAAIRIGGDGAWSLASDRAFQSWYIDATTRSTDAHERFEGLVRTGVRVVGAAAPRSLWPAAGTHAGADALLRAHPFFDDGIADAERFGRHLAYANLEMRRWIDVAGPFRVGIATFVDAARVSAPASLATIDAGMGIRMRLPAVPGVIRIDAATGITDRARALSLGWSPAW